MKRYEELNSFKSRPRSGKPKKFNTHECRAVKLICLKNPELSSVEISNQFNDSNSKTISPQNVRKILFNFGLKSYAARKKPFLSKNMRYKRKLFAKNYSNLPDAFWNRVVFSDETYICINPGSVMNRVRRFRSSNVLNERYIQKTSKFPTKIMIWACFCSSGLGEFYICDGTMNSEKYLDVLETKLLPTFSKFQISNPIHLDDSAPSHRTKAIKNWHIENNIQQIDWPGNSPDLNPIENLWNFIKRKLQKKTINSKRELIEEFIRIYRNEIPSDLFNGLAMSMNKRLKEMLKNNGASTKY